MAGFVSEVIDAIKGGEVSDWHFWIGVGILAFALFALILLCWGVFALKRRHRKKRDEEEAKKVNLDNFWQGGDQEATTALAESPVRARGNASAKSSLGPKQPSDGASRLPTFQSSHKSRTTANGVEVPASSSMPRREAVKQPSFGKPEIQPASNQPLTPEAPPRSSSTRATPASKLSPQKSLPSPANAKTASPAPNNMQNGGMYPPGQNPAAYQAQMGMYWPYQMGGYQNPMAANMYQQAQMGAYPAPMMQGVQRQPMPMPYQNPMMAMQQPGMQQPGMQQRGTQQPQMGYQAAAMPNAQPPGAVAASYQTPMMQPNTAQAAPAASLYQVPPAANAQQPSAPAVQSPAPSAPPPPAVLTPADATNNSNNTPAPTSSVTNDASPPGEVIASEYRELSDGISDSIAVDDMHVVNMQAGKAPGNASAAHHVQVSAPPKPPSNARPGLRPYLAPRAQPDRSAGFSFAQSVDGESQGYLLADEMGGIMAPTTSIMQSEMSMTSPMHGGADGAPMGEAVVQQDSAKLSTEPTLVTKSIVAAMRLSPVRSNVEAYRTGSKPSSPISEDQLNQLGVMFWRLETRHQSKDPILVDIRKSLDQFHNEVVEMDSEHLDSAAAQSQGRVRIPMYEELIFVERVVGNGVYLEIMDDMGVWVRVPIREGDMISLPPQLPYRLGIRGCSYTRLIRAHMM